MKLSLMWKRAVEDLAACALFNLAHIAADTVQVSMQNLLQTRLANPFEDNLQYIHMLDTIFTFFHLNKVIPFDVSLSDLYFRLMII